MQTLAVPVKAYGTDEELASNIRSALDRNLRELSPSLVSHDGTLVIAGSGPSLPDFVDEIAAEREKGRPILACNGAHDFLCDNGIIPNLFLTTDPRDTIVRNTQRKNPDTIYLLASRCSPKLFDHLSDCQVMLWHSWCPGPEQAVFKGHFGIGGGTTSGTRAIYVGYVMGFRKFAIYGMDSCLAADRLTKRFSGELADKAVMDIHVGESGKVFYANPAMAQQADEIQHLPQTLIGATFDFKGPGLLAAIWAERRRLGMAA